MLFAPEEKGQGLVEYALIIILIAIMLIASIGLMKDTLEELYSQIVARM